MRRKLSDTGRDCVWVPKGLLEQLIDLPAPWLRIFIHLLLTVNPEASRAFIGAALLPQGAMVTSVSRLSRENPGCNPAQVRACLKYLVGAKLATVTAAESHAIVVEILDWASYQDPAGIAQ
jgi:hypothetical protein